MNRKINLLKHEADLMLLTKDQVRQFGNLTRSETWEKAIAFYEAVDSSNKWIEPLKSVDKPIVTSTPTPGEWLALRLTIVVGITCFVVFSLCSLPYLAKFVPVRVTIQIGK